MRYAIGIRFYNKEEKFHTEGLATFDKIGGFPSMESMKDIVTSLENKEEVKTLIYESAEEAEKAAAEYTKNFRRDDVWKPSQVWLKSKYIITFFPLKIDNNKFQFLVEKTEDKTKGGSYIYLYKKKKGIDYDNIFDSVKWICNNCIRN